MSREANVDTEAFKALGDPVRWSIVQQIARQDYLPASVLEDTLPVSKPTISYHTKILSQAGLIETRKRGRHYFYRLRPDALAELVEALQELAPGLRPAGRAAPRRPRKRAAEPARDPNLRLASGEDADSLLTW